MLPENNHRLERYFPWLRLQVRQWRLDPRLCYLDHSDVASEVFTRALEKIDGFVGTSEGELRNWFRTILRNFLTDEYRRLQCGPQFIGYLHAHLEKSSAALEKLLDGKDPSPSQNAVRNEVELRVAEAIESLPDDQREVVILRYRHGTKIKDIAEQLGKTKKEVVTKKAVAGLLYRAQQRLRQVLDDLQ
ncbi:MAG TPA: sigma-70 family RNA polymerase sigma factor [Gemmataceae bacterium]|nr:sigma-70 family RNA polymerase sigma factor [Gemmataceae bacterium]